MRRSRQRDRSLGAPRRGAGGAATLAALLTGCGSPPPPPEPPPAAPAPEVIGVVAGEHTVCPVRADGRVSCTGGLELPPLPLEDGVASVDDHALCVRGGGKVRCLRRAGEDAYDSPFVQLLRGPGSPCGRDASGAVYCFAPGAEDEATAPLVPVPLPGPTVALASPGDRIWALLADHTLLAFAPPGHGGSKPIVLARDVDTIAGNDWTLACWLSEGRVTCSGPPAPAPIPVPGATTLAVGRAHVCAAGPEGLTCLGLPGAESLGRAPVSALAAGADSACVVRAGALSCAGPDAGG